MAGLYRGSKGKSKKSHGNAGFFHSINYFIQKLLKNDEVRMKVEYRSETYWRYEERGTET